ncbi:ornithine carbamoyltransferase [Ferrimonas sp. YFM]|uniref:ornithine carbamoyltransferase n=1 Tax=Ferrimonas sp. YFM TaxID=3028878 RepID=UPI0025737B5D|nr:ornithine carbamoyltransferase [Ferrimonas sp. YFM]
MNNFIDPIDFTNEQLLDLAELSLMLKSFDKVGACPELLKGKSLGMIFEESSTRTRISFEVAMTKLGGHALYLRPGEIHMGTGYESLYDTAKVVSRFCDIVCARVHEHDDMLEFAKHVDIPLINAMTWTLHPCQVLSDLMTILEHKPKEKELSDLTVAWIGDTSDYECVANNHAQFLTRFGIKLYHVSPEGFRLTGENLERAQNAAEAGGGQFIVTEDAEAAIRDADFVYTGTLWYHGQEDDAERRKSIFIPNFQVNEAVFRKGPDHMKFMHYLPAIRNAEVTDWVMDHDRSIIFDQAENRMYSEMALLVSMLQTEEKPRMKAHAENVVKEFLMSRNL